MAKEKHKEISPRQRALNTVKINIERIYNNVEVEKRMLKARHYHAISGALYENCEKDLAKVRSIHKLIKILTEKWIDQCHKTPEIMKIINARVIEFNIKLEVPNPAEAESIVKGMPKIASRDYLKDVIENYARGASLFFSRMNINPEIWHSVLTAMLLTVPEKKVLRCITSILEKDYLPSISDFLRIRINELTEKYEIGLIWDKVKREQKKYKDKYGYINAERKHSKYKKEKV